MKKTSLNELMGSKGEKGGAKSLSLDDLGGLLGERMPKLEFSPVGRLRLTQALRQRFGDNYRNLPGIEHILKEFDKETKMNVRIQEIKQIKFKPKEKK
jgi:hypothetical protein